MRIRIETIPHSEQRYDTCGDYWISQADGSWQIRVSDLGHERYEALIAIHELIEMLLCDSKGITMEAIDKFDRTYLEVEGEGEPGDCSAAPYYTEHQIATGVERILAAELRLDWNHYEASINKLEWHMGDNNLMTKRQLNELDQFITGHYGEDDPALETPPDPPPLEEEDADFDEVDEDDEEEDDEDWDNDEGDAA